MGTSIEAALKKDRNITWQPYLPNDARQDIMEIYERLDVEMKGYVTQQQLHTALNEAFGKPIRAETVRTLVTRMDISSRHGLKVSYHDFLEYMAQKLLSAESYEDLLRSEQGPLMQEVGYKVYELLERYKRKQMLKDAMAGGDGIQRLLHLTTVPMAHRNRRKGQSGADLLHSEAGGGNGARGGGGGPSSAHSRARRSGAAEGGTTPHSFGDMLASRSSAVSRHSSGSGADIPSPAPVAAAAAPRAANTRSSGGRAPRGRPGRNSAPAAGRVSSALVSLLSRVEEHGMVSELLEDRGSSQRWRKSTSQLAEELQQRQQQHPGVLPGPGGEAAAPEQFQLQQQQQQPVEAGGAAAQMVTRPLTLTVVRPLSSNPATPHSSSFSTQTSGPSQPGSPHTGLATTASAPAGAATASTSGEAGGGSTVWPQRRLVPHASASAACNSPGIPNPFAPRSSTATLSIGGGGGGAPAGRGVSRPASPALSLLAPLAAGGVSSHVSQPLPASPLGGRVEGWRSATLMAQVLEVERIDVHSLVMEDLRAAVGLSTSPTLGRTQVPRQSQQLHPHPAQPPLHPSQQLSQQPSTAPPPASPWLQLRSHSFPRQSPVPEADEEEDAGRGSGGERMDAAAGSGSCEGDSSEGDVGAGGSSHQRAGSLAHTSQLPPAPQAPRQLLSSRQSQPQPQSQPRRPHSQPQTPLQPQQSQQQPFQSNTERRREGGPVGTWVTADPEGVLGQLLRGSGSSGGQPRTPSRPRFQSVSVPAAALRLDVSGTTAQPCQVPSSPIPCLPSFRSGSARESAFPPHQPCGLWNMSLARSPSPWRLRYPHH